jgi:hypothetical protein
VNALAAPSQEAEVEAIAAAMEASRASKEELKAPTKPPKSQATSEVCAGVLAEATLGAKAG